MKHRVGTPAEWLAARIELLKREKELTRRSDELAQQRRELPWVPVEKEYVFETNAGRKTLAELFDGRSQLLVYHFMFGPTARAGLQARLRRLHRGGTAGRRRVQLCTPKHADIDLREQELQGLSAFVLEDGVVYHTYSTYDRGTDALNATWQLLDRTPKGARRRASSELAATPRPVRPWLK
jgi:predicted dithiol-disulfide oxidoreductase (DUF899 family)